MKNPEERTPKETKQIEKHNIEDSELLLKEKTRREAWSIKEQALADASKVKEDERARKRAIEETEQLAREQERKKAYLAREKQIAEEQEARKLKANK